jgi:predicted nucleic acid-binding protein
VTGATPVRGNFAPDAHIAAILFQHGVRTLYSNDRDVRKFPSLDLRDPFI